MVIFAVVVEMACEGGASDCDCDCLAHSDSKQKSDRGWDSQPPPRQLLNSQPQGATKVRFQVTSGPFTGLPLSAPKSRESLLSCGDIYRSPKNRDYLRPQDA